jgi:hypothetical protein
MPKKFLKSPSTATIPNTRVGESDITARPYSRVSQFKWRKQINKQMITLSSSRVNPLPALDFMLYLRVWHCTMGRKGPDVGHGKIFTAFFWRAAQGNIKCMKIVTK